MVATMTGVASTSRHSSPTKKATRTLATLQASIRRFAATLGQSERTSVGTSSHRASAQRLFVLLQNVPLILPLEKVILQWAEASPPAP